MSMRSLLAGLTTFALLMPAAVRAQEPRAETSAEFAKARQQYVAGDARPAAQTLLIASLHLRQQVGRSKDEVVGMKLLDAEGQLEKLAAALKNGTLTNVRTLDQALTSIDRLLAQHHLQMVSAVLARPRAEDAPVAARDLDRAAFHFERSITLNGTRVAEDQAAAIADARTLAKEMESTRSVPKTAIGVVAALERHVVGGAVIATEQH